MRPAILYFMYLLYFVIIVGMGLLLHPATWLGFGAINLFWVLSNTSMHMRSGPFGWVGAVVCLMVLGPIIGVVSFLVITCDAVERSRRDHISRQAVRLHNKRRPIEYHDTIR